MSIKLCYNNEIHRVSKLPADLKALLDTVQTIFKGSLPEHFALQYDDIDGDRITVCNDDDYKSMTEADMNNSTKTIKVYIVPVDANSSVLLKQKKTEENFQNQGSKPEEKLIQEPLPTHNNKSTSVENGCNASPECCKKMVKQALIEIFSELYKGLTEEERNKVNDSLAGLPNKLLGCGPCNKICDKPCGKPCEKVCNKSNEQQVEPIKEVKEEPKAEVPQPSKYDFAFLKEISTIPSKITAKDLVIYKTISIKNTGTKEWPKSTMMVPVSEVKGEKVKLLNISVGKEMSAILIINSPCKPGKYTSTWRICYTNEKGEMEFFGNPFSVEFEIAGSEAKPEEKKEEPKKEEPKKEEPKKEESKTKEYPEKVLAKAKQMKEMFPDADVDKLCEIISSNADIPVEELIENYLILGGK